MAKKEYPLVLHDSAGSPVSVREFSGKYLVLDFWSSDSDFSLDDLPKVQRWYDELKENPDIALYSVFCTKRKKGETPRTGTGILSEKGYAFPSFFIDAKDPILREIGVRHFPTVVIFSPDGKLIYSVRSSVEGAKGYLRSLGELK